MNNFIKGALSLSLLGLVACIDSGGDDSDDSLVTQYSLEALPSGSRPWILLEGAALDPRHLSFMISQDELTNGEFEPLNGYTRLATLLAINNEIINRAQFDNSDAPRSPLSISASSSNTNVVSIENGKLVANNPGKADISLTLDLTSEYKDHFEGNDWSVEGFQGSYEFGEVTVCPYVDVDLNIEAGYVATLKHNAQAPLHVISYTQYGENPFDIEAGVRAIPEIDVEQLANAGLTIEDCKVDQVDGHTSGFEYIDGFDPVIAATAGSNNFYHLSDENGFFSVSGVSLMGFDFPNLTVSKLTSLTNIEITEAGFGGNLVPNALNPVKVEAFSSELNQTVDITTLYTNGVLIGDIEAGGFQTFELIKDNLPTLSSDSLPVKDGVANFKLNKLSGLPGSTFTIQSSLLVDGVEYDTSEILNSNHSNYYTSYSIEIGQGDGSGINFGRNGNRFTIYEENEITVAMYFYTGNSSDNITYQVMVGDPTDETIRGRWVQADTGEDHYITGHSVHDYTLVSDNLITYQTGGNQTSSLIRAGIENVAVSGDVNVVVESNAQNLISSTSGASNLRAINPNLNSNSLGDVSGIDLILENVNTGEEIEVEVAADGSFTEEVPTGEYNVEGTIVDGDITYNIDTRITVEKDAIDTGNLNLAQVGLYNFDVSISGCEYGYKCYAGTQYTFTIKATNTGFIASSAIEAMITDISNHENVSQFEVTSNPTTGAARGDSIDYQFTATFTQPAQDTVIELPITLTDADARTWEDVVKINLSQYDSLNVNINAYNDALSANVRGYLMLEGRTPIRVNGSTNSIKVPNKAGASYELILANQEYNEETPYGVGVISTVSNDDISSATGIIGKNENADDTSEGATELSINETNIAYISAGDVDHYLINIPE